MNYSQPSRSVLADAISAYRSSFEEEVIDFSVPGNQIYSPVGAWLLLALVAGAAEDKYTTTDKEAFEKLLGFSVSEAYRLALELIETAPENVCTAVKGWVKHDFSQLSDVKDWVNRSLENGVAVKNGLPSQFEVDTWVDDSSLGIIKNFPVDLSDESLALLFATVVATKVSWADPFQEVDADDQMIEAWGQDKVLLSAHVDEIFLLALDEGYFACHVKSSHVEQASQVNVVSVIGPVEVSAERVSEVANMVAADLPKYRDESVNLFDLDINETLPYYLTLVEENQRSSASQVFSAILPAWKANQEYDLTDFAFSDAARGISSSELLKSETKQVAIAEFNKKGFEAAAVTVLMMRASSARPLPSENLVRRLTVTFRHDYAVAASVHVFPKVAEEKKLWNSLPIFNAWVSEACEVTDRKFER